MGRDKKSEDLERGRSRVLRGDLDCKSKDTLWANHSQDAQTLPGSRKTAHKI